MSPFIRYYEKKYVNKVCYLLSGHQSHIKTIDSGQVKNIISAMFKPRTAWQYRLTIAIIVVVVVVVHLIYHLATMPRQLPQIDFPPEDVAHEFGQE